MLRVLYITDQTYRHGGGERVLTNKSNYLVEKKYAEVFIVTTEQNKMPFCYPINSKVTTFDLKINYNRSISYFKPSNFIKLPRHYFKLKKTIKRINPDIIITLSTQFDYFFLPFICKNIPKIKEFHSSGYSRGVSKNMSRSFFKKSYFKFIDFIESKYTCLVVLTDDEKKYYNSNNLIVIPNALKNHPLKASKLNEKLAISAGRIAPVKQFDKLILAWSFVVKKFPEWKLEIYGNGDEDLVLYLNGLIIKENLQNNVLLCGETNNLESKMISASLYVMSSETECFPMVLLEAMSCGLPVVSFDCPNGPRNIIKNRMDGVLVEQNNVEKLAEAICKLINDKSCLEKKGMAARENIKRFNENNIMGIWVELFNKLKK